MPKILMEQSAIKNMKMARETATTDPQRQLRNPFVSNYSALRKAIQWGISSTQHTILIILLKTVPPLLRQLEALFSADQTP